MRIFELALKYTEAVIALGAMYHDQDRQECPELWIKHDAAYKELYAACQENEVAVTTRLRLDELYEEACSKAHSMSSDMRCTYHVNARVRLTKTGSPIISGFELSDWYVGGSTIATYTNGEIV